MPNESGRKKITLELIIAAATLLLSLVAYLRPPDPAHPTNLSFLYHRVELPLWLAVGLLIVIVAVTVAIVRLFIARQTNNDPTLPVRPMSQIAASQPARAGALMPEVRPTPIRGNDDVRFETAELLVLRFVPQSSQHSKGIVLMVENNRLDAIEHITTVISSAYSFDTRHSQFRTVPAATGAHITKLDVVMPSTTSKPTPIVTKRAEDLHLMMGDNTSCVLKWPDNDQETVQRWKLNLSVGARTYAKNSLEKPVLLRHAKFELIVRWDSANNVFGIEELVPEEAGRRNSESQA